MAKLTFDDEFQQRRKQGAGSVGQGLEGAAKVGVGSWPCKTGPRRSHSGRAGLGRESGR